MTTIQVLKSFVLNLGGVLKKFEAGMHEVEDEVAGHWYVQAHSQDAAAALVEAEEAAKAEAAAAEQAAADAKAKADADEAEAAATAKKGK